MFRLLSKRSLILAMSTVLVLTLLSTVVSAATGPKSDSAPQTYKVETEIPGVGTATSYSDGKVIPVYFALDEINVKKIKEGVLPNEYNDTDLTKKQREYLIEHLASVVEQLGTAKSLSADSISGCTMEKSNLCYEWSKGWADGPVLCSGGSKQFPGTGYVDFNSTGKWDVDFHWNDSTTTHFGIVAWTGGSSVYSGWTYSGATRFFELEVNCAVNSRSSLHNWGDDCIRYRGTVNAWTPCTCISCPNPPE